MSVFSQLDKLRQEAVDQLRAAQNGATLEQWRVRYLGVKGALKAAMQYLKDLPAQDRPAFGKVANELKEVLTAEFERRRQELSAEGTNSLPSTTYTGSGGGTARKVRAAGSATYRPPVDMTLPGVPLRLGHKHILTQTIEEITDIFARMGFSVATGPEVEDERHNFNALNMPPSHPARDELNSFYISERVMLRSQTSTVQIRVMENTKPPVRIIAPGRVYRPDTVDATHSFMFHQVEGLYVDEGVSMADLTSTLDQFCKAYFGPRVETRLRPSFFPFTEPSAEVDMLFRYPDGSSRWIELGGCGMVDPNVLAAVNYDTEKYTGFAFGFGIDRMVMGKYGIPDIRLLFESDVRFLRQF